MKQGEKTAEVQRARSTEFWYHRGIKAYDVDPNLPYPVTVLPDAIHMTPVETLALIALRGTPRVTDFLNHAPVTFDPVFDPDDTDLRWCSHCSNRRGWLHASAFGVDTRRSKPGKVCYRRYCKQCEATKEQERYWLRKWRNGYQPKNLVPLLPQGLTH